MSVAKGGTSGKNDVTVATPSSKFTSESSAGSAPIGNFRKRPAKGHRSPFGFEVRLHLDANILL
jgi:hypothetical protein